MKNLDERQREMRERMARQPKLEPEPRASQSSSQRAKSADLQQNAKSELERRIALLEAENARLRAENERLRCQKVVYVERQKSAEEERRERVHNYFKYSNARRW